MTFNTNKIPKEIKIGYQKNVELYIPNSLRCYKCQWFWHHQDQCTRLPGCGRCGEYDIHNDCQKDYKCANCQGNHAAGSRDCDIWKKEKEKTRTYSKYHLPRSEKDVSDYKICKSDKNIPTTKNKTYLCEISATKKPKVVAQLVNEMRALIQKMKTVIEAVTEKLTKDQTPKLQ